MKYEQVKELSNDQFRRLTGIKRSTFDKMIKKIRRKKLKEEGRIK